MRLDTIARIEEFIQNALLSSPLIPLGVNVVRLAADLDTEGIAQMAYSTVITYTGASARAVRDVPLVVERTLQFQITHSAQSYLTQSGHEYALQMCRGAQMALENLTPTDSGSQITAPLFLTNEKFEGLTDSSHYVYVQTWEIQAEEINPVPPMDPCVQRGNCSALFPNLAVQEVLPGDVLFTNQLFAPVLPPPDGEDYDEKFSGVTVKGDDLIFNWDASQVFLENWADYSLVSTGTFDTSGDLLICRIYDANGEFVRDYFASNYDGRRVIQIAGAQPTSNVGFAGGLTRSSTYQLDAYATSGVPEPLRPIYQAKSAYGYVAVPAAQIFENPLDPEGAISYERYGRVFISLSGVIKTFNGVEYYEIGKTKIGRGFIKTTDFKIFDYNSTGACEEGDQISDILIPEGGGNSGKIDSCD